MKLTGKQTSAVAAVLVTAIIGLLLAWPSGPFYKGQSVHKWFYRAGDFDSPSDREMDREAFRAMGREADPFLVRRLEAAPSERIKGLLSRVSSVPGEIYRQRKEMWQFRAAYLLGEMGPAAESAETNLTTAAVSGNWSLRGAATVALMKIKQQPIEPLIEKLKDTSDWRAWYENAIMVGQFGSRAEGAVPILLEALQHTNNIIQAHALIALGWIARQPDKCIPAIMPFLRSPNVSDRQKAMGALLAFGTNTLVARKSIQSVLTDSEPWVREQAGRAMKVLDSMEGSKISKEQPGSDAKPNDGPATRLDNSEGLGGGRQR